MANGTTNLNNFYTDYSGLNDWLGTQGITQDMWNSYSLAEQKGIMDSLQGLGGIKGLDQIGTNLLDIPGMSNMDLLKGGLGIGQLGLGVLSYLDQSKTAGKQRELMNQQIDQNKFLIDQAKQRQADISKAFGGGNTGLAASSVQTPSKI